jgi:hypothetical protein
MVKTIRTASKGLVSGNQGQCGLKILQRLLGPFSSILEAIGFTPILWITWHFLDIFVGITLIVVWITLLSTACG